MSDRKTEDTSNAARARTTRRNFVGGVGAVMLGCASDDSGAVAEGSDRELPSPPDVPGAAGSGSAMNSGVNADSEPALGATPGDSDEGARPTELQGEGTPEGAAPPNGTPPATTPPATAQPGTCTLYPEQTEGPYYVDGELLRADIREGKAGTPLSLELLVVVGQNCVPLANAAVDIWHCDATGVYSGFTGQLGGLDTRSQVFLRGTQLTGADGRVRFQTIYPGWYPGRTTHIHFKVHLSGNREVTSQLYFDEALNREVYTTDPYAAHGQKDTSNAADLGRNAPLLAVTGNGSGYTGSMTITVAS
ncbi:MAG TPA: intradiol ring-cleavage dioxygenase [Polyangiaceae bacterium]|nr:intradiol ring-cleavage dioxygenase [Polyangiaceae bacterium]